MDITKDTKQKFQDHTSACQGNALECLRQNLETDGITRNITEYDAIPEWGVRDVAQYLNEAIREGSFDCQCHA